MIFNLFQNKAFKIGFYSTIILFLFINCINYKNSYNAYLDYLEGKGTGPHFSVASYSIGFPFEFCRVVTANPSGIYTDQINLAIDVLIIFTISFLIGLLFKKNFSKLNEGRVKDSEKSLLS